MIDRICLIYSRVCEWIHVFFISGTSAARNLELVTNEFGKIEHSLYGVLNYTLTPGGNRLLRANILQPPSNINTINTRLDCIAELMDNEDLFYDLKVWVANI